MEYIQEIALDLNTHSAPLIVNAKQNDVDSRILRIQFIADGEIHDIKNHNISFRLRKPDSHFILISGKVNSDGTADIILTKQCLAVAGRGYADIMESDSTGILSTASFILDIQPNAGGSEIEEAAISSDEFNSLTDFILKGNEIIGDSEKWAIGTRNGDPIDSSDPAYNNYSEYWSEQANAWANGQIRGSDIGSGPQKNNNAKHYSEEASRNGEQWAIGKRDGSAVPSSNPAYNNNAKYWADEANYRGEAWARGSRNGEELGESSDPEQPGSNNNAKYYSEEAKRRIADTINNMYFNLDFDTGILYAVFTDLDI